MKSEWEVAQSHEKWEKFLCDKFHISPLLARLLVNRGADSVEKVEQFLMPDKIPLGDPYVMLDMDKAVEELVKIRKNGETLVIYGDYDVDGVTGTALYYLVLSKWGWNVDYHIPSRLDDGYGLNKDAIRDLHEKGIKRLMTVDCGITSVEETTFANSLGFEMIVTDHHEAKEVIPPAAAIIDPKRPGDRYPFKDFSGVGVAYKVLQALQKRIVNDDDLEEYLDIVALGTVADIVPILEENRYFVYKGMKLLSEKKRVGIAKLMELSNVDSNSIKAHDIGFKIAPKINAVGRIDSAYAALKLILEEDPNKAYSFAKKLVDKNRERQFIENKIYQQALAQLDTMKDLEERRILVLAGEKWHPGVIGIVASRILSIYHKPTLMISIEGNVARGSARSIEGVNIVQILKKAEDLLEEYGGHKMAAGFSLKTELIPKLDKRLQEIMKSYDPDTLTSVVNVDAKMSLNDVKKPLFSDIEKLRPYGSGNPEPVFEFEDLNVERIKNVGKLGKHVNLTLRQGQNRLDAIGFGFSHLFNDVIYTRDVTKLDVIANVWKNSWNGRTNFQLNIVDVNVKQNSDIKGKAYVRTIVKKRKFSKVLSGDLSALVIGDPYAEGKMILEALIDKSKRLVVVTPSNSALRDLYNSLIFDMKGLGVRFSYVDAMNSEVHSPDVIFTNTVSLSKVLKGGERVILCEPQLVYESDMLHEMIELFSTRRPSKLIVFSSFLTQELETELLSSLGITNVFHEFHKRDVGVIDDRNLENRIELIMSMIENQNKMMIVFSDQRNLKEVFKTLCDKYPQMCKGEKIVSYISNSNPYHYRHVVELVRREKVRILLTTSTYASTIDGMDRIVYYDFPRNHISLLKPPALFEGINSVPVIHMLFGEKDVEKNIRDIEQLFPSYERVLEAAQILRKNCKDDPEECLVSEEISSSKALSKIYLSILEEIGVFDGKNVTRIPDEKEVEGSLREKEGNVERKIIHDLKREIMASKTRDIVRIFHNPFSNHAKSVS